MDVGTLEQWLWDAACEIRGPIDAPKFKDYILPLVFLKRLSDVFDDEIGRLADEFGGEDKAIAVADRDHSVIPSGIYVPETARWSTVSKQTTGLGEHLTTAVRAVARENPKLQGVIDVKDFNETAAGQRVVDDPRLQRLVQILGKHRLGIDDVEPDILGRAYEYLLRKFAEGGGASAGEFYTPREVAVLMARILDPQPGMTVYDPCCGSAGLLIKCHLRLLETHGKPNNGRLRLPSEVAPLRVYGQEFNASTYAIARMNAVIHDIEADIAYGDTIRRPSFLDGPSLRRFDLVAANPMWNQPFPEEILEHDPFGRFVLGIPTTDRGDWAWIQHMLASTSNDGRLAVVLDTGSVSRGSETHEKNKELQVRQAVLEADLIEAVVLLPVNLFYNTSGQGLILVLNKSKRYPGEVLLINGETLFMKDGPKNRLTDGDVGTIANAYELWESIPGLSVVVELSTLRAARANLTPSRYVEPDEKPPPRPSDAILVLSEAEIDAQVTAASMKEALSLIGMDLEIPSDGK